MADEVNVVNRVLRRLPLTRTSSQPTSSPLRPQKRRLEDVSRRESSGLATLDRPSESFKLVGRLMALLCAGEASALLSLVAVYRLGVKSNLIEVFSSITGWLLLGAGAALFCSIVWCLRLYRAGSVATRKQFVFGLLTNLLVVAFFCGTGEVAIRIFAVQTPTGDTRFANKLLLPRNWNGLLTGYRQRLAETKQMPLYHEHDARIGWTIGKNRRSSDGLYYSSLEGLRAPGPDLAFASRRPRYRIALVGDSFTFGQDVRYEESWGARLEQVLGNDVQVLNFGVGGYGVDQAYLRYVHDVLAWRPDIVIFSFISHDLIRCVAVHNFLLFPGVLDLPFDRPRFHLQNGTLVQLNQPVPAPSAILSQDSLQQLPLLDYDVSYHWWEWDRPRWRVLQRSYLFRYLTSVYHPIEPTRDVVSDQQMRAIGGELFRSFVRTAQREKTLPLVFFFPSRNELPPDEKGSESFLGVKVASEAGVPYSDFTACIQAIPSEQVFGPDGVHYSARANAALADCMVPIVRHAMAKR